MIRVVSIYLAIATLATSDTASQADIGECDNGDPECHNDIRLLQAHLDLMEQAPLENAFAAQVNDTLTLNADKAYEKRTGKGRAADAPPLGFSLHAWTKCDTQDGASVPVGQKSEGQTASSCAEICKGMPECTGFMLGANSDNEWSKEGHCYPKKDIVLSKCVHSQNWHLYVLEQEEETQAHGYQILGKPGEVRRPEGRPIKDFTKINSNLECYAECDKTPGCMSMSICTEGKGSDVCHLKDQVVTPNDPVKWVGRGCQTHYKASLSAEESQDMPEDPPVLEACPVPEPGKITKPGAEWTEEEALIVKAKIYKSLEGAGVRAVKEKIDDRYGKECKINLGTDLDPRMRSVIDRKPKGWNCDFLQNGAAAYEPPKLLRLGFHDCLRYEDCSGGCDGCLNFENMFTRHLGIQADVQYPQFGDNNDLAYTADALELIFQDKSFPPGAAELETSLADGGKSRADLWAFATLVAIEIAMGANDKACSEKSEIAPSFEFPTPNLLESNLLKVLDAKCIIGKQKMDFMMGRQDCQNVGETRAFESVPKERHPSVHMNGEQIVQWFKDNFGPDFIAKDVVAIMGAHSIGGLHVNSLFSYVWTRTQAKFLNNQYYKNMAEQPSYMLSGNLATTDDALTRGITGTQKYVWHTGVGGGPASITFRPIKERKRMFGAPYCWTHIFEMCPICYKKKNGAWKNRGLKFKAGLVNPKIYTDECCKACYEEKRYDPDCMTWTANDQMALNTDIGLMYKFGVTSYGRPKDCPGFWQGGWDSDKQWLKNDFTAFPPGGAHMRKHHDCPKQDIDSGDGRPLHEVVEQYADDQDLWVKDFLASIKKQQQNGYAAGDLITGPDVFNENVGCFRKDSTFVCEKGQENRDVELPNEGGISADADNYEYQYYA